MTSEIDTHSQVPTAENGLIRREIRVDHGNLIYIQCIHILLLLFLNEYLHCYNGDFLPL